MEDKDLMVELFKGLGFKSDDLVTREGYEAKALLNNPYFKQAVAEYKYALVELEDNVTADMNFSKDKRTELREYYSMLRILLDGLVNTLDVKVFEMETLDTDTKP